MQMTEQIPMSVLEQLRSQDGKLFQNESILSFYTDIKYFVQTSISSTLRTSENLEDAKRQQLDQSDSIAQENLQKFVALRANAVDDLQECLEAQNEILHNDANVLVNETQLQNLLKGLFRRIAQHDSFVSKKFLEQDPIKIDFLFREAFRMTLYHDCTIMLRKRHIRFETPFETPPQSETIAELRNETSETFEHANQKEEREPVEPAKEPVREVVELAQEPAVELAQEENAHEERTQEERQTIQDVRETIQPPSPPASVAGSVVSRAMSAITSVTQLKKPRVRTVILSNDDDNHSRFTSSHSNIFLKK